MRPHIDESLTRPPHREDGRDAHQYRCLISGLSTASTITQLMNVERLSQDRRTAQRTNEQFLNSPPHHGPFSDASGVGTERERLGRRTASRQLSIFGADVQRRRTRRVTVENARGRREDESSRHGPRETREPRTRATRASCGAFRGGSLLADQRKRGCECDFSAGRRRPSPTRQRHPLRSS